MSDLISQAEAIRREIIKLQTEYQSTFGQDVIDVAVQAGETISLTGTVLLQRQLREIQSIVQKTDIQPKADWQIIVLEDVRGPQIGWWRVDRDCVNIWRVKSSQADQTRTLATQARRGEWLRVLVQDADQALVQCEDLSIGWLDRDASAKWQQGAVGEYWQQERAIQGKLATRSVQTEALVVVANQYLQTPYLLGGRTIEGIDCSAFCQLVYLEAVELLLPRHSWEQLVCGIEADDLQIGDLIFARAKKTERKHVGMYKGDGGIVHATQRGKKVVQWPMDTFRKVYDVHSQRRYISFLGK